MNVKWRSHPPHVPKEENCAINDFFLSHKNNSKTTGKLISLCRSLLVAELRGPLGRVAGILVRRMFLFLAARSDRCTGSVTTLCRTTNLQRVFIDTEKNKIPEKSAIKNVVCCHVLLCFVFIRHHFVLHQNFECSNSNKSDFTASASYTPASAYENSPSHQTILGGTDQGT